MSDGKRRPRRRVQRIDLLTDARALTAVRAARRCGTDLDRLLAVAAGGLLAPWAADICPNRGWVFHPAANPEFLDGAEAAGVLWIPNLDEDLAVLTANWLAEHPRSDAGPLLLGWLRVAEEPLHAPGGQFVWWCNQHHDPAEDGPPTVERTAARWTVATQWYEMLTDNGIAHTQPHLRTTVAVTVLMPDAD